MTICHLDSPAQQEKHQIDHFIVNREMTHPVQDAESVSRQMKKPDSTLCSTPQENATVFYEHFNHLYNREENFDAGVFVSIPYHDIVQGYDHEPTDEEIRKAIQKLRNTSPGNSGIQPQIWKCLIDHPATGPMLTNIVRSFWRTENVPIVPIAIILHSRITDRKES